MYSSICALALLFGLLSVPSNGRAADLAGKWSLRVLDKKEQVQVEASVRFSDEGARSCMAGRWRRVDVLAITKKNEGFFPASGALAYTIEDGRLVFGRTEVCDGYLFLSGNAGGAQIKGDYSSVSIGGAVNLGSFSLSRLD
jgi:hypothetical protein